MRIETLDRLIAEDMKSKGMNIEEMVSYIPKRRRKEFKRNVKKMSAKGWVCRLFDGGLRFCKEKE